MSAQPSNLSLSSIKAAYQSGHTAPQALILRLREQALTQSDYCAWIYLLDEGELQPYFERLARVSPEQLPLYGVPFAIKDNIDLAGVPTTAACREFAYTPSQSAFVVQALIAAGAVPLGKTNLDQFATGLVGVRSPYGETKNPFNTDYIAGGSSSGSAVATALGQVSFALGTDTAGSGRVPAVLNNLIGHKPTRGLLSNRGVVPACRTLDCVSIFALTAADAADIFDMLAIYDADDTYSRENHYANRRRYLSESCSGPFRFGVPDVLDFQGDRDTARLFECAVAQLKTLGGEPVSIAVEPFLAVAKLLYEGPWVCERRLATEQVDAELMLPVIREIIGSAAGKSGVDAFRAQYQLAALKRRCDAGLAGLDFLLTPTMPTTFTRAQLAEQPIARNSINGTYTNFVNLLDYSATAVPVGFTSSGVPWGVTLVADAFHDIRLLSRAAALQRSLGLPLGASADHLSETGRQGESPPPATIDVVVCGAHLDGLPLNWQLTERGGCLQATTQTAPHYQLYALPDGKRPALVRVADDGRAIAVEVWRMPAAAFGTFVAGIPQPLGIGKVELADGSWRSGFICDHFGLDGAENISRYGGWRAYLAAR